MAYKILIIDDDTELLRMLKKYFEIKKYEIITAENGTEGLNKIKLKPDIILLDVNMPDIDGIEVCRMIRDKVTCPVLFLTARVEEQDVVNGLSSGGDDYILKPFSLKELDARITAHLKREVRRREKTECCFSGELAIDYKAKTVQIHAEYLELTKLEYEIIEFLAMNPGMVFDKDRIYEKVCGYERNSGNIQKRSTLKPYGGWDTDGQNKKSFREKNDSFVYGGCFTWKFYPLGSHCQDCRTDAEAGLVEVCG